MFNSHNRCCSSSWSPTPLWGRVHSPCPVPHSHLRSVVYRRWIYCCYTGWLKKTVISVLFFFFANFYKGCPKKVISVFSFFCCKSFILFFHLWWTWHYWKICANNIQSTRKYVSALIYFFCPTIYKCPKSVRWISAYFIVFSFSIKKKNARGWTVNYKRVLWTVFPTWLDYQYLKNPMESMSIWP